MTKKIAPASKTEKQKNPAKSVPEKDKRFEKVTGKRGKQLHLNPKGIKGSGAKR